MDKAQPAIQFPLTLETNSKRPSTLTLKGKKPYRLFDTITVSFLGSRLWDGAGALISTEGSDP